ncbi:NAD(P)/FAD-dependent oxidoreductase [Rhodococcoides kroppenstedtii]|uniref:NAD(P)/FAD-dependent oxidoreductase n=1 Tax=Rhodococcoides kroppenstedtii TaxID=293050 RepID=UPI0028EFEDDF|nr:NAD(P)-binding protein [Rhodococcus kroppenstedtii]
MSENTVTIVGAGISGAACLLALRRAGVPARLVDRGRAPGGRMASPLLHDRRVDIGAGYFTVRDDEFGALVGDWAERGLVREWTDTFTVLRANAEPESKTGPTRWGTPGGLRSLVRDLLRDVPIEQIDVESLPPGGVVLAMPDPQAARLTAVPDAVAYDPVITVVLGLATASPLPFTDAAFVQDDPDVEFLALDGARRGDGASVLVAHTTAARARRHLDDPDSAVDPVVDAVRRLTGTTAPEWTHAHRWTFAKPSSSHEASFGLVEHDGRLVGFAGDQWCPEGSPRVESAWRSGTDLGAALAAQLGV